MKRSRIVSLVAVAIIGLIAAFTVPVRAQATAPANPVTAAIQQGATIAPVAAALTDGGKVPTAVTQISGALNAAAPAIGNTVTAVQAAGNDPAAIVAATSAGISQATAAAAAVPSPYSGYLLMAAIIASFVQSIATLFVHKSAVTALANSTPTK